jgi:Carbohydrate family 9 binding domain-like
MRDGSVREGHQPGLRLPEMLCPKTDRWDLCSLDALNGVWATCARVSLRDNLSGRPPKWGTEVRLGWSGDVLHGLYQCQDPNPWATKTTRDDSLWEEEVVEIFLDPFGDSLCYFEIEINPLNTVTDLIIRRTWNGLRKEFSWKCEGLVTACGTLAYGWVAAFQIPFASLGDCHPTRSSVWRVNFSRIDRPKDQPLELSAWSPTLGQSFHVPRRFGVLRFDQVEGP